MTKSKKYKLPNEESSTSFNEAAEDNDTPIMDRAEQERSFPAKQSAEKPLNFDA